jgi:hypothetical protein
MQAQEGMELDQDPPILVKEAMEKGMVVTSHHLSERMMEKGVCPQE